MFEVRKWMHKPILNEVIGRFTEKEDALSFVKNLMEYNEMTVEQIKEYVEVYDTLGGETLEICSKQLQP